jgi:pimeloyl-ACP methyl ester carboxylesterase
MVLVHPLGGQWRLWEPVLPALEERFDVIAVDLPGFGESPPLPAGREPTVPALAVALAEEMDRLGLERAHLVGNSIGGWVSIEVARLGRASTVTAIAPAGMATNSERRYEAVSLLISRVGARALAPAIGVLARSRMVRRLSWQMFARPTQVSPEQLAEATRGYARSPAFPGARRWLNSHGPERLDQIRCPVTIAWGTKDRLIHPRQAQRWVDAIADARLVELPGLGHAPMSDDPDLVARTIIDSATPDRPGAG